MTIRHCATCNREQISDKPLGTMVYCAGCIAQRKLQRIEQVCRAYNGPHVTTGTHEMARRVLEIVTE